MSQHRMDSHEYNLRDCAGGSGRDERANQAGQVVAGLLLVAAHLAALAAVLAVVRQHPAAHGVQAMPVVLGAALAGLVTWAAMRICRGTGAAAAVSLVGCWGLAAALPGRLTADVLTLLTVAAIAAGVDRRGAAVGTPVRSWARLQFSLRTLLALMTLVALAAAASRVSWPAMLAVWAQPLMPLAKGGILGLAIASAHLAMAGALTLQKLTRRTLTITTALVVLGSACWLYPTLGLGPAWGVAAAAAITTVSLWASAAVCRPAVRHAAASVAGSTSA